MKILHTYDKVKRILENHPESRDSYNYLLYRFWFDEIGKETVLGGVGYVVLSMLRDGQLTHPESIMRTRRRVQQDHPELRGCSKKEEEERVKQELGYK